MDAMEQLKQDLREGRIGIERLFEVLEAMQRQVLTLQQQLHISRDMTFGKTLREPQISTAKDRAIVAYGQIRV